MDDSTAAPSPSDSDAPVYSHPTLRHVDRPTLQDPEDFHFTEVAQAPQTLRLEIGRLVEGRLRIVRLLGRGGMSEVYEAYDESIRRTVAVKLVLLDHQSQSHLAIFAEARAMMRVRHANVLELLGIGAIEAQPFVELESATGGSLADRVARDEGKAALADAIDVIACVADGLAALHAGGIVHRDIKADNILFTEGGRPVIADFGLALCAADLPAAPRGIIGTPAYMAPEAILGATETFEQYAKADQYSLAVTSYLALTGVLPIDGPTPQALLYAQMAVDPKPAHEVSPHVPLDLSAILSRALSKKPDERFASVADFRLAVLAVRDRLGLPAAHHDTPAHDVGMQSTPAPALRPTMVAA